MGEINIARTLSVSWEVVVSMVKWLVNYLYMPDDGRDQEHKEFCVKCGIIMVAIGVPIIIACWQ
ncbi:hypothetical protein [Lysinibacillus sp. FSL W8-0953]|uniref:hypothetical protein n=1 Tax=Lysinibacillus sp. FSL W8-0953 TaxID=2954640 RepID=UPI0030F60DB0